MVKSWTTNFATIYLVVNNVLDIQMESATPIWIFTFENLSNNIKLALQFGQCLVPHILLYNFKTLQDYNSQNENPLANVGSHLFTHLWGCMFESPYTLSTCFPCHALTFLMSPKLMSQQWPREWKFKYHFVHVIIVIYISKYNHVDVARKLDDALWVRQSIDNLTIFDLFWCYWIMRFMWWHGYLSKIKLNIYI
jgi:hypothetical protein